MLRTFINWIRYKENSYLLRIPCREETENIFLLGDPGTGKSQTIHQFLNQIALRSPAEAGICYDPACEFLETHFDPPTDVVLNPLDARFPYWSPSFEVESEMDRQLVAESFFPCPDRMPETNRFFIMAARDIFSLMLERCPKPASLVKWMCDEEAIDKFVAGTEVAHKIHKKAGPQRVAVLSTLADAARLLRMLPAREQCKGEICLSNWAAERKGWIFITSTQDTRAALRPLQAALLNILMRRLLSVDRHWGEENPCWFVVDEVHALKYLPALPDFLVECRKYGVKTVMGTQSKHQMKEHYGDNAFTMLAAAHLKIYLRCNESEAAQWIANNIGEEERERPRVGATEAVEAAGRNSTNYSTAIERRLVVSKEQIMALPNLHGYWNYSGKVVPFRIAAQEMPRVARGFVPRQESKPVEQPKPVVSAQKPQASPAAVQPQGGVKTSAPVGASPVAQNKPKQTAPIATCNRSGRCG